MNRLRMSVSQYSVLTIFFVLVGSYSPACAVHGGEDTAPKTDAVTRDVDGLLARARQEMAAGNLQQADVLVKRAEAAKVTYPVLHFGDTPARVRKELDKLVAQSPNGKRIPAASGKNPKTIENKFAAGKQGSQDPFLGSRYQAAPQPASNVAHVNAPKALGSKESNQKAKASLLSARRALVVGDVGQAELFLQQARQSGVQFNSSSDSPDRVAQSIREFKTLKSTKDNSASWRHSYAKFMVAQAGVLIEHGDLDRAEQVSHEAVGLGVSFEISETTPQDVLERVRRVREGTKNLAKTTSSQDQAIAKSKSQTLVLLAEARKALLTGNMRHAEALAGEASRLQVPESHFAPLEDSPARFAADLERARAESTSIDLTSGSSSPNLRLPGVEQRVEEVPHIASAFEDVPTPLPAVPAEQSFESNDPYAIISEAEQALRIGNREQALHLFQAALEYGDQFDPITKKRLYDHLQMLSRDGGGAHTGESRTGSLLNSANSGVKVLARQLSADVGRQQSEAAKIRSTDPEGALKLLDDISKEVAESELDEGMKRQLQRRISMTVAETERFIKDNKAELELDAANREVLDEIERSREVKLQVQQRLAELNDQYNQLRDEHRYAEMEIVAKRAYEMAPDNPVAKLMWTNAKFIRREMLNQEIISETESGFANTMLGVRKSAGEAALQGDNPIAYDAATWGQLKNRKGSSDTASRRSARELEIQEKLKTPVLPRYDGTPLAEVVEQLSQLTEVNIHLDELGLGQEGVRSDEPVTLNLKSEVSLESVLNLILEPLHLTYMIKDEVLKITSEEIRDGEVIPRTYNVADLVIPIPNFVPSSNTGLQGLINDAYAALPQNVRNYGAPVSMVPSATGGPAGADGMMPGGVLPQQFGAPGGGTSVDYGAGGPGNLGGAANADFDSLIDLIVSTVEHDSWMENGTGDGEIQPFPTNLSLVISQTQRVHEQIADLLEQLRRLQDLQVTIEVRFIRLNDRFFERIGIDFDFNIEDETGIPLGSIDITGSPTEPSEPSSVVGITAGPDSTEAIGDFSLDLDIPFRNSSFNLSAPSIGTPADVGTFGFAILSDIEAYFLINASQGDRRSNVLSAPKVTLFNGQQAVVLDTAFMPFVISVIPVVGEFAAAQQPVIVVLSEGTMLTVQAVVSDDRRYVRLTLVPFFSEIGEVDTFTFEGSETTTTSSATSDQDDDGNDETNDNSTNVVRSGTTVQLPTFQVISVSTTVSVPDGGTVLLGGIKRLSEQRNEFGVPLLNKLPYVDRLFRNVGIGRETESLMMMVTPHIIIQEEEEERLGIE